MNKLYSLLLAIFISIGLNAQDNQRFIVMEHFTNTTCPACGNRNPVFFNDVLFPYEENIIHVEFHHNLPVPDLDPFQLFNPAENNERFEYYNSPGQPRMVMNGSLIPVMSGQPLVPLPTFTAELGQTSPIAVEVSEVANGNMRDVIVEIHTLIPNAPVGDLVVRVGVVEKYILFPTYFESEFHNVFRQWLNTSDGTAYTPAATGSSVSFSFSYALDPSWQPNEIYTIAYVQDNITKEVINGGSSLNADTPPALNIGTLTATNIECPGDLANIQIQISGGCPPYSVNWTNSAGMLVGTLSGIAINSADEYTATVTDDCGGLVSNDYIVTETPGMSITETIIAETMNDMNGSISLVVSGGTAPYNFIWSNGATDPANTGLTSGVYELTIVDANGCYIDESFIVQQLNNTLNISSTSTPSCLGQSTGSLSIDIQGGTAPYTATWSNGLTGLNQNNLDPGNYIIVIEDAYGFSEVEIATIEEISYTANISAMPDVNGSSNGSVTLNIQSDFTYMIVDAAGSEVTSFNNLSAGDYNYFVDFGNGCQQELTFSISEFNYDVTVVDNTCFGESNGSIVLENVTPSDLSISWTTGSNSNSVENLAAGNYCFVISDGMGTSLSECYDISEPTELAADAVIMNDDGSGTGAISLSVTNGTAPYTYSWTHGDTASSITNLSAGAYGVTITDANGCSISETYTVSTASTVTEIDFSFSLVPNPSTSEVKIECNSPKYNISIYDNLGKEMMSGNNIINLDVTKWNNGLYIVHIQTDSGSYLHKLIKSN